MDQRTSIGQCRGLCWGLPLGRADALLLAPTAIMDHCIFRVAYLGHIPVCQWLAEFGQRDSLTQCLFRSGGVQGFGHKGVVMGGMYSTPRQIGDPGIIVRHQESDSRSPKPWVLAGI